MAKAIPFALAILIAAVGCNGDKNSAAASSADGKGKSAVTKPALKKLEITDTVKGAGLEVANGDVLFMRYKGALGDGTSFDQNVEGKPFSFTIGSGGVIKGWDEGLIGMKVGGKRTLGIPWEKAYGAEGRAPKIPAKADLYFDVELLDVLKKGEEDLIERTDVKVGTGKSVAKGSKVTVNYVAKTIEGEFDSTIAKKKPYSFTVGSGDVYEFFEIGVTGMKKGGVRKLRIGPQAGFGPGGRGTVGPTDVLYYEITLLDVK